MPDNSRFLLAAFAVVALALVRGLPAAEPPRSPVRLLVPAYFYPHGDGLRDWKRLIEAADRVPILAIVNPASGPGQGVDPNYSEVFRLAKRSQITLIGYVTLGYAKRPAPDVKAEVDRWRSLYPDIRGIFFDEQPSGPEHVAFATECFAHARRSIAGATLVTNPGVPCDPGYLAGPAPIACLFEHHEGFDRYRLPAWAATRPPDGFAALLYRVETAAAMGRRLGEVIAKGFGTLYITDAQGANPWDRLPSYWSEEVAEVARRSVAAGRAGSSK